MTWDASGNRVGFTNSTGNWNYVYDPTAGIPAVIEEVNGESSVYYIREPNGALIARVSGETIQYYGFDDLGNTLFLTGSAGTVTDKYTYDAWGNVTSHTGSTSQPYQYVGQLGYYTHYQDSGLGLLQLGVRFYEPVIGRFTQRDPIPVIGVSDYIYVKDLPTAASDASGLRPDSKALHQCLRKARNELFKCLGSMFVCIGLAEEIATVGCILTGPEFIPCIVAVNLILDTPALAAIAGCGTDYWQKRKDCFRQYGR